MIAYYYYGYSSLKAGLRKEVNRKFQNVTNVIIHFKTDFYV